MPLLCSGRILTIRGYRVNPAELMLLNIEFWVQESAFFVGRPFQAVKKPPEKTAWKGRPSAPASALNQRGGSPRRSWV